MDFSPIRIEPEQALQKQTEDQLLDCNPISLSEKCTLVRERVHSFADLKEVANACFFGDEEWEAQYDAVGEESIVQRLKQSRTGQA